MRCQPSRRTSECMCSSIGMSSRSHRARAKSSSAPWWAAHVTSINVPIASLQHQAGRLVPSREARISGSSILPVTPFLTSDLRQRLNTGRGKTSCCWTAPGGRPEKCFALWRAWETVSACPMPTTNPAATGFGISPDRSNSRRRRPLWEPSKLLVSTRQPISFGCTSNSTSTRPFAPAASGKWRSGISASPPCSPKLPQRSSRSTLGRETGFHDPRTSHPRSWLSSDSRSNSVPMNTSRVQRSASAASSSVKRRPTR